MISFTLLITLTATKLFISRRLITFQFIHSEIRNRPGYLQGNSSYTLGQSPKNPHLTISAPLKQKARQLGKRRHILSKISLCVKMCRNIRFWSRKIKVVEAQIRGGGDMISAGILECKFNILRNYVRQQTYELDSKYLDVHAIYCPSPPKL